MKSLFILGCLTGLAALAGCAASNDELRARLDTHAAFDLGCRDVTAMPLEEGSRVTKYGVTGCGKQATYVLNPTNESWVMSSLQGVPTGSDREVSALPQP